MTARLILSVGILTPLASLIALRRRGLPSGSPPPMRAAIVISLISLVNARPRLASIAPFLCLILCHLEWPDIDFSLRIRQIRFQFSKEIGGRSERNSALSRISLTHLGLLFRIFGSARVESFGFLRFVYSRTRR